MALTRYRHFWSSKLELAPVQSAGFGDLGTNRAQLSEKNTLSDVDITGVLKAYSPPRIVREVRQVETGKYLNERILGRLQPEETNFSITMPADFEVFYAYNSDYQFEIVEELHTNVSETGYGIRYVIDEVRGTLFDREWTDFMQNGQDRDVTLHFILKTYKRMFSQTATGAEPATQPGSNITVFDIDAGLDADATSFMAYGRVVGSVARTNAMGQFLDEDGNVVMTEAEAQRQTSNEGVLVNMFGQNAGVLEPSTQSTEEQDDT